LSVNVIEHVENVYSYLTGFHRMLKPGGLLFVEQFDVVVYMNTAQTSGMKRQKADEAPYYFVGRKKQ
jgi:cyclopropane fatty-acyl-phospholipid synthase-like methyltransferase